VDLAYAELNEFNGDQRLQLNIMTAARWRRLRTLTKETTTPMSESSTSFFRRMNMPLARRLIFALAGITRPSHHPQRAAQIRLNHPRVQGISGLSWGVVSWPSRPP
jgi:hypothetical protein